ncbi:MAG TPA: AMP-binding protein, partial [Acidimicrobiales bacterium]|nr:AMP-binding protein [Acidimicrobiales bacterium]
MAKIGDIAGIVRTGAKDAADRVALVYEGAELTWRELDERSSRAAQAFRNAGIGAEDRVARIDKNTPEYFDILFGTAKLNAVTVDVNWRLAPPEMLQIVNDAQATVLVVGAEFLPHLEKIEGDLATVKTIVVCGSHATHPSWQDFTGSQPAEDPGVQAEPDDVCLQLYTSGTTGLPKGVMLTNRNLFTFIDEVAPTLGLGPDSVSMVVMPLFHIAGSGWSLVSLAMGAKTVMHREIDPNAILAGVVEHRVTHAIYVPAVLQVLLMMPGVDQMDLSSLELIAYGASPITEAVLT